MTIHEQLNFLGYGYGYETTEKLGCPTDNIPDNRFFTSTFNFIIFICNDERTNIYLKFYFEIMFLSHNNVVFIIKSKSKILINSLKSAYNLAHYLTFWLTLCFKIYWILLFLPVFIFIFNGYDKNKCFKKSVVG